MPNEVISTSVPEHVANEIKSRALKQDRSVSYIAGQILRQQIANRPAPEVQFARRRTRRAKQ